MESLLDETACQRANKDTLSAFRTFRFWLFELLAGAIFTILVFLWTPSWISNEWKVTYQVLVPVFFILIGFAVLYFVSLIRAPYKQRDEAKEKIKEYQNQYAPNISVKPVECKRDADWKRTEHLMWAELQVTNSSSKELKGTQVNITYCLALIERQTNTNQIDYALYNQYNLEPFCIYWSERQTEPKQINLIIPSGATRSALVAFQDNSNGGNFIFNSLNNEWIVGGVKICVEISSLETVLWRGDFYIECHPNYAGKTLADYKPSKFEFVEWDTWVKGKNITLLASD
jgi:hypothetical protein